ncbi:MAG: VOC family protein [Sphingobacteriales bacterium]|nr:MAG: VOC family protein [Sphingobacteriales bacterium]
MQKTKLPDGHQAVMTYLIIPDAKRFLSFTKGVFGATEQHLTMADKNTIRHAEVAIGGSTIMFADSTSDWPAQPGGMFIYVDDTDAVYQKALNAGASSIMPVEDKDYGRTCGVKDPHGNTWWITSIK